MNKILLIGKFDAMTQNLNNHLGKSYNIQLCSDSLELVQGMMKIVKPDMVLIYLKEAEQTNTQILDYFYNNDSNIPVLILDCQDDISKQQTYPSKEHIKYMNRPINIEKVLNMCCELTENNYIDSNSDSSEPNNTPKSILIVDDSALLLRNVRAMLNSLYNVYVATSGEQALKVLKKNPVDLVILDYEMPEWDGKRTLEEIRQDKELKDIPVIFLTGVADKEHIAAVLGLNPAGYFLKPPEREKFLDAIDKILIN
jgi:response regulator RpfG family c-di-GMP phosphodiesterase